MKVTKRILREMIEAEMLNEKIGASGHNDSGDVRRLNQALVDRNLRKFSRLVRNEFQNLTQEDWDEHPDLLRIFTTANGIEGWEGSGAAEVLDSAADDDFVSDALVNQTQSASDATLDALDPGRSPDPDPSAGEAAVAQEPALSDRQSLERLLTGRSVIRSGQRGDNVRALQRILITRLNQNGLESVAAAMGEPDGAFGPKTKDAVEALQRKYDIDVDGVVGRQTASAILANAHVETQATRTAPVRRRQASSAGANAGAADDGTEDATADGTEEDSASDDALPQEEDSEVTEEDIEFLNAGNEFESAELEEAADEDGVLFLVPATLATARVLSKGNRVAMAAYNMTIANQGSRSAARKAAAAASREIARGRSVSRALRMGEYTANMAQSGNLAKTGQVSQFLNRGYQTGSRGSQAIAHISRGGSYIPNLTKTLRSYKTFNMAGRIFFVTVDAAGRVVGTATQLTKTAAAAAGRLAAAGGRAVATGANTLTRGASSGISRNLTKFGVRVAPAAVRTGVTRVAGRAALTLVGAALAWPVTIAWLAADGLQWWGRRQLNNAKKENAMKSAASALKMTLVDLDFVTLGQGNAVTTRSITPMDLWQLEEALAGRHPTVTRADVAQAWLDQTDLDAQFDPSAGDDWIDLDFLAELLKDKADELGLPTGPTVSSRLNEAALIEKWQKIIS